MRRLVALSVIFALVLALCRAPFFHLHEGRDHGPNEPGHHNLSLVSHIHLRPFLDSSNHSGETSVGVRHVDRNAQPVDILLFEQETPHSLPVQVEQVAFCSPLLPSGLTIYELTPRIHDPPWAHPSIPRSPPA